VKSAGFNEAYSELEEGYNNKTVMLLHNGTAMELRCVEEEGKQLSLQKHEFHGTSP
jgi:hypothetical protein